MDTSYVDETIHEPSIEFLELFALTAGILIWSDKLRNISQVIIFCDNQAVVSMVNNLTSGCQYCMKLLRVLVLVTLKKNFRVFVKFVATADNGAADAFSRGQMTRFWKICRDKNKTMKQTPEKLPGIWPPDQFYGNHPYTSTI